VKTVREMTKNTTLTVTSSVKIAKQNTTDVAYFQMWADQCLIYFPEFALFSVEAACPTATMLSVVSDKAQ